MTAKHLFPILLLAVLPALAVVGNVSNTDKYAWTETSGWMTARPSDAGVTVHGTYLSGYAWSEGVGFIHFQDSSVTAYQVRLVYPGNPTSLASTSHTPSSWGTNATVDMAWSGATDNGVGIGGYSVLFDSTSDTEPDATLDVAHPTQSYSEALADGTSHYFHLRACDTVGNCAPAAAHVGPYWIDATPPQVASLHTVADTGDGVLAPGKATAAAITQVAVVFDEDVRDPAGDTAADDVTNPANYLLFGQGGDGTYETVDCAAGVAGTDTALGIDAVTYDAGETTGYLKLASGTPLPRGRYRLHACGTTSILDPAGNALDGDGDGAGGDDFAQGRSSSTP